MLLELGALLRILVWERGGIRSVLDPALPEPVEAIERLFASELLRSARPIAEVQPSELSLKVFRLALSRIARGGAGIVGCDVALQGRPSDDLPRLLARVLWATRPK